MTWILLTEKNSGSELRIVVSTTCPTKFKEVVEQFIPLNCIDNYDILVTSKVDKKVFGFKEGV